MPSLLAVTKNQMLIDQLVSLLPLLFLNYKKNQQSQAYFSPETNDYLIWFRTLFAAITQYVAMLNFHLCFGVWSLTKLTRQALVA